MKSLFRTLGHFFEALLTGPSSNNWASSELYCTVSALSDYVLLDRIAQSLRLLPRKSSLRKPGIDLIEYHPE